MPTISRFFGILIRMYWDDHNYPHIHAKSDGMEAVFDIRTAKKTKGRISRTGQRLVEAWMLIHRDELLDNWERATEHLPLYKIDPLR